MKNLQGMKIILETKIISREGVANWITRYRLLSMRLKTSYDWLCPEWQNTRAKRVYLYQTLQAKRAQLF